jgi:two-component system nitrogen regulation response regulator NtrX
MARRVLVVDDEKGVRDAMRQILEFEGIEVETADSGDGALKLYPEFHPHLVFLDVKMAGMDGLETLAKLREEDPAAQVVMISGHGTIQTAVEATQLGAYDFLEKVSDRYELVGESAPMRELRAVIERVAPTGARVLNSGENGSGKELVARAIHRHSPRADQPFVEVNCAAIPGELIESELFGHMKGSFTGAFADRPGKFEQADGGTLFLDEVGDMSAAAQAKVLRALEEGVVTRIGATKAVSVSVRVVAATNKNLADEIAAARFREDLYYRLNVVPITVPPLRSRREDIPLLAEKFVDDLVRDSGVKPKPFDDAAITALARRDWPGNVRELRNAVERLLILSSGESVTAADVDRVSGLSTDSAMGDLVHCGTFEEFKQQAERSFLQAKLDETGWNVSETARKLNMPRSNLYKKIEKYGLARD